MSDPGQGLQLGLRGGVEVDSIGCRLHAGIARLPRVTLLRWLSPPSGTTRFVFRRPIAHP